jgi:hypothetical protein
MVLLHQLEQRCVSTGERNQVTAPARLLLHVPELVLLSSMHQAVAAVAAVAARLHIAPPSSACQQ